MLKTHTGKRFMSLFLIVGIVLTLVSNITVPVIAAGGSEFNYTGANDGLFANFNVTLVSDSIYQVEVPDYFTSTVHFDVGVTNTSHTLKYADSNGDIYMANDPGWGPGYFSVRIPISTSLTPIIHTLYVGTGTTETCEDVDTAYTYKIVRTLSLSGLSLGNTFTPAFAAKALAYSADIPEIQTTIDVTASASDNYSILINGQNAESDVPETVTIDWSGGTNMVIPIVVSYDDEETIPTTYNLTLNKKAVGATPEIYTQPKDATYVDTTTAEPLVVVAGCSGELSYQWYDSSNNSDFSPISGAIDSSYTPTIDTVATTTVMYYRCVITNIDSGNSETVTSSSAAITVKVDPTPYDVELLLASGEQFPTEGLSYAKGSTADGVTTNAATRVSGGNMSFDLRVYDSKDAANFIIGVGRTTSIGAYTQGVSVNPTFTFPTDTVGTFYYDIRVNNTVDLYGYASVSQRIGPVTIYATDAQAPTVSTQPQSALITIETDAVDTLTVVATVSDGGALSYQWYEKINDGEYVKINGADSASYTPTKLTSSGKAYYYCEITNTVTYETNVYTNKIDSAAATLTYQSEDDAWSGIGTASDPYLLGTADDLTKLRDAVNSGVSSYANTHFKMTADITLPADWVPIGSLKSGASEPAFGVNILPFSGTFDGGGFKITILSDGLPLFGYVREAMVKNLEIYGEKIASTALIHNYVIDYGATGSYGNAPRTVVIDNVTLLTGSKTLMSGFIGGDASGRNTVEIKNSTIQSGVEIGYARNQSRIGSFGGAFNGSIINSTSAADVYGTSIVGGLVGEKGQSMGSCSITGSIFSGTVTATGNYVGGLIGRGYNASDAPNSPCVTIQNCYVAGSISGVDYVGGLMGAEAGIVQCWDNGVGYIQNNHFSGTITATGSNVGAIIGYIHSLNTHNVITNNYFIDSCGVANGIGYIKYVDTSDASATIHSGGQRVNTGASLPAITGFERSAQHRSDDPLGSDKDNLAKSVDATFMAGTEIVSELNSGAGSWRNWAQGTAYPVFNTGAAAIVNRLTIEGDYKAIYYIGESLSTANMLITAHLTDGTTQVLNDSQVVFSGFDSSKSGPISVIATYEGIQALLELSVVRDYTSDNGNSSGSANTINVRFALIGASPTIGGVDVDLANKDYKGVDYERWIPVTSYTMEKGATVLELFTRALGDAEIEFSIKSGGNYIDSIRRPGGGWMSEFTNGPNSGWMYTIGKSASGLDGVHPNIGLRDYVLENNDVVIWHYVNDYSYEIADWFAEANYPKLGDGKLHSKWLDALSNPSGSTDGSLGGGSPTTNDTPKADVSETITVSSTLGENGVAKANISTIVVTGKIDDLVAASKSASDILEIVIDVETSVNTKELNTHINKAIIQKIADTPNVILTITSALGDMTFDNATVKGILSETTSSSVEIIITMAQADKSKISPEALLAIGDNSVFELAISIDGTAIHNFKGTVTAFIPYNLGRANANTLTVYHVNENGELTAMSNVKYITKNGVSGFEFTTTHFSLFMIAPLANTETSDWTNPFSDVKESDWFYDAVKYVNENELMVGGGDGKFNPNAQLSRAMLVQVLYNNEGRPALTSANPFTDVTSGQWYTDAIVWAADNGIVSGYGGGLFGPNDNITREQVVVILNNYAKWKNLSVSATTDLANYTDAGEISDWALSAMKWANATELMLGRSETTLVPKGETTRAEIATLLMKFIENIMK